MKLKKNILSRSCLFVLIAGYIVVSGVSGCGQIGSISGGAKDTLPPVLRAASPKLMTTSVTTNSFTFSFNEYIDLKDVNTQLIVSPFQKKSPKVRYNGKSISVVLQDSLLPNTTYSFDFGTAIRDVNEGNILYSPEFVFSTGLNIDSFRINGVVRIAEDNSVDSTLIVMLYKGDVDSAVLTQMPMYITRLNGNGAFSFKNLPSGKFLLYALKDGDGSRTYNSPTELFAFYDIPVMSASDSVTAYVLYAYAERKIKLPPTKEKPTDTFAFSVNLKNDKADLLKPLTISFTNPVQNPNDIRFQLLDSLNEMYFPQPTWSSTRKDVELACQWKPGMYYRLIIPGEKIYDSLGNAIQPDTVHFSTKLTDEYGHVILRFANLDFSKKPVLQFFQSGKVVLSDSLLGNVWERKMILPGEYELRLLFDTNENGSWDPGNYLEKKQPERAIVLFKKLMVRAGWTDEQEIKL